MNRNCLMILPFISVLLFSLVSCTQPDMTTDATEGWEDMFKPEEPEEPEEPDTPGTPDDPVDDTKDVYADEESFFKMRGLVMGWSDVNDPKVLDYIKIAKENGLNTFSIYGADRSHVVWKAFARDCADAGIFLEYEEHMMSFLLPRALFDTHPEYFRMNQQGVRVKDANGCPSSEGALAEVYKNAIDIGKRYNPTNNRYYFWLDDGGDVCYCDKCKELNDADQALIFENEVIKALKTINPDAMLAHLCYANTTDPPKKVKPHEDIFLEFAPFYRSWDYPLADTWVTGNQGMTHGKYLRSLEDHLKVFPAETAQVLEYWMDDSLFSGWNPNKLKPVPWKYESVFLKDLDTYAKYGIRHITCYCAYVGPSYVNLFGFPDFLVEYAQALRDYEKK
ncbi:MAG: DUF4838 domain-containing protein [Bacteroidales bacterium]|nr:DUF4838 domain-containing protein [Bacteroidales bacterium]